MSVATITQYPPPADEVTDPETRAPGLPLVPAIPGPADRLGSPAMAELRSITDEVPRRLEVLRVLSRGGMGEVSLVRRSCAGGVHKLFALKRVIPALAGRPEDYERMFLNEARLAALISHPGVCETIDVGRCDGGYYILMEYLRGVSLAQVMRQRSRNLRLGSLRFIGGLLIQAALALDFTHGLRDHAGRELGLIHRDISPGNLFVTWHGSVKLLDFGLAKIRGGALTRAGVLKGKLSYMSPEQLAGNRLDARSDIYSLGIVLHELITGRPLFRGGEIRRAAPDVRSRRGDVPVAVAEVCARALAEDPDERFGSAREFADALEDALVSLGGPFTAHRIAGELERAFPGARDLDELPAHWTSASRSRPGLAQGTRLPSVDISVTDMAADMTALVVVDDVLEDDDADVTDVDEYPGDHAYPIVLAAEMPRHFAPPPQAAVGSPSTVPPDGAPPPVDREAAVVGQETADVPRPGRMAGQTLALVMAAVALAVVAIALLA